MEGKNVIESSQSETDQPDGTNCAPEEDNMDTTDQTHDNNSASVASHETTKDTTGVATNGDNAGNDKEEGHISAPIGVTTKEEPMESDRNEEEEKDTDHQADQNHDLEKNSDQNVVNEQQSQSQMDHSDPKKVVKDDQEMSQVDNDNDQGNDHEDDQNKLPENESKVLEGDQESQGNQEDKEPSQNGQSKNDTTADGQMETTSEQDDQSDNAEISNQGKIKTDQSGPSTPPHTTNTNADSQATEIIDGDSSHDSQGYHTPDQDRGSDKAHSSDDEEEKQYDRPWYKFWGSSDSPGKKRKIKITRKPSVWSARDTVAYRNGYPGKKDNKNITKNLEFYQNKISSYPHGDFIDVIHKKWWGDYDRLEYNHSYIQWLFPIREQGLNMYADMLQLHEAEAICSDPVAHGRLLKSYKMMLDFYGLKMTDEKTGELGRADNWKERFCHLNRSMHNYLRITRILKCLGEMQLEHLKAPFVRYVLHEIITEQTLYNCLDSCINYWLQVIRGDEEREDLLKYAESLAIDTHTTTTVAAVKGQAEGETKKKTESREETQPKKETQSTKGKQEKDESQNQSKKQSHSKKKQIKSLLTKKK